MNYALNFTILIAYFIYLYCDKYKPTPTKKRIQQPILDKENWGIFSHGNNLDCRELIIAADWFGVYHGKNTNPK